MMNFQELKVYPDQGNIYLVSSTQQIGKYWGNQLHLSNFKVISRLESIRGLRLDRNRIIIIDGERFDYPDINPELIRAIEPSIVMSEQDDISPNNCWIRVDDNNREDVYVALLSRGFKINTTLHDKIWGFYICPNRGISQLSSGGSVVTEKQEIVFMNGIFSPIENKRVVNIYCSNGKLKFYYTDGIYMIDIDKIEKISIQSDKELSINQGYMIVPVNSAKSDLELINRLIESELEKSNNQVNFLKIK